MSDEPIPLTAKRLDDESLAIIGAALRLDSSAYLIGSSARGTVMSLYRHSLHMIEELEDYKDGANAEAFGHDQALAETAVLRATLQSIVGLISRHGTILSGDEIISEINRLPEVQKIWVELRG